VTAFLYVLAQTGETGNDPFDLFVKYGIAGFVIAALITGLLWAKPAVDGVIKRAERAEAQRDEMLKVWEEKILPALADSTAVNKEMKPILMDVVRVLEQAKAQQSGSGKPNVRRITGQ
jgi:hypothetical protein